ncbi:MAG: hypothetical protein R6V56_01155 [Lentisphaeria bacterium]
MLNSLFRHVCRFTLTLILLVLALTLAVALAQLPVEWRNNGTILPLGLGFGGGFLFFLLISRVLALYVFGHELTHLIAAKLFRRETGRFRLGLASGSVAVERPNIWITLAPYFVPVYTLLWIGLYGIVDFFWKNSPAGLHVAFTAGVGITYAFHVRLTLYALRRKQTDLQRYGKAMSLAFITFCNILLLYLGAVAATGQWDDGVRAVKHTATKEWRLLGKGSKATWIWLKETDPLKRLDPTL